MKTGMDKNSEFSLLDNAVINLIVEKTKLNQSKYSMILSKTVVVYVILIAVGMYASVAFENFDHSLFILLIIVTTILLFIVYLYVVEHFAKMDRDIDEVVTLLQTKAFVSHKKSKK